MKRLPIICGASILLLAVVFTLRPQPQGPIGPVTPQTPACLSAVAFTPNDPLLCGFSLVFDDEFASISTIDTDATGNPDYKWYVTKFFGYAREPAATLSITNGILTISPTSSTGNYNIATAGPSASAPGYVGSVFGAPANAYYFEASIAFDQTLGPTHGSGGYPSFWSMAIEHMVTPRMSSWTGQAAEYEHFIEDDFFEFDTWSFMPLNAFGSAGHDWYGNYNVTCSPGFCGVINPLFEIINQAAGGDVWTGFHRIGQLWVLGTAANNWHASQTMFVDGVPCLTYDNSAICKGIPKTWTDSPTGAQGNPPPTGTALFSIADRQHLNIVLGSGPGWPMKVDFVRVWKN
jgi:hypothetical protein